ncbi:MAG: LysM peptidoglycan-binding domain-containing protein [Deltaproteobacteria bacterium]|nr:LysM peptidoglycan-binding domain-containing protein [Deltaproteobacteria bacterium]
MSESDKTQKEERDFFEDISDELEYPAEDKTDQRTSNSSDAGVSPGLLVAGCVGAVVLVALIAFFFAGGSEVSKEDLTILKQGLDRIETRLGQLEGLDDRMNGLEKEVKRIRASVKNAASRIDRDQKKSTAPPPAPSPAAKQHYTVQAGDSLYSIAKRHGLTVDRLCELNHMDPKKPIQPGQRLVVSP